MIRRVGVGVGVVGWGVGVVGGGWGWGVVGGGFVLSGKAETCDHEHHTNPATLTTTTCCLSVTSFYQFMQQLVHTRLWRYERLGKWWVDYLGHTLFMFHISGFHRYIYIYHSQTKRDSFSHPTIHESADRQSTFSVTGHTVHWFSCKKTNCNTGQLWEGSPARRIT